MRLQIHFRSHSYSYFEYEHELAARELIAFGGSQVTRNGNITIATYPADFHYNSLIALTYFRSFEIPSMGIGPIETRQYQLEHSYKNEVSKKRQQTRYSVHCWHEYKGRFNPQIVHGILNCFFDNPTAVLDPFCGGGTTLIECAHKGINAVGIDVNPFSVFLSRSKINALHANQEALRRSANIIIRSVSTECLEDRGTAELEYLSSWFPQAIFREIEALRKVINDNLPRTHRGIFLCLISDLLREYSYQEPTDLRIRRRFTPFPIQSFRERLRLKIDKCLASVASSRGVLGRVHGEQIVRLGSAEQMQLYRKSRFDGIVTSPPYATALPYIDTQRLSIVWLKLVQPSVLADTEESLIGAREADKPTLQALKTHILAGQNELPADVIRLIKSIAASHSDGDGFRKRAVPPLLFRYFSRMKASLTAMRASVKRGGSCVLVVGTNHTTAGGKVYQIPTPQLLASIGEMVGWQIREIYPLQAYHRYGLHSKNAVQGESLVVLKN